MFIMGGSGLRMGGGAARGMAAAASAKAEARSAKSQAKALEYEIERLLMITEALWSIIREKMQLNDVVLMERIAKIDLEDGKLDGRKARSGPPAKCPKCGNPISRRRQKCLYCGAIAPQSPFER